MSPTAVSTGSARRMEDAHPEVPAGYPALRVANVTSEVLENVLRE